MVLDELANGNNNLHPPAFDHLFERNGLSVDTPGVRLIAAEPSPLNLASANSCIGGVALMRSGDTLRDRSSAP